MIPSPFTESQVFRTVLLTISTVLHRFLELLHLAQLNLDPTEERLSISLPPSPCQAPSTLRFYEFDYFRNLLEAACYRICPSMPCV